MEYGGSREVSGSVVVGGEICIHLSCATTQTHF